MLCVKGTIPTVFSGVTYMTPVRVWITPGFPAEPPLAFVEPTKGV